MPPPRLADALAALAEAGCPVTRIGHIVEGHDVRVRAADGSLLTVTMKGWEHFA